jgi:hypothetical protein
MAIPKQNKLASITTILHKKCLGFTKNVFRLDSGKNSCKLIMLF